MPKISLNRLTRREIESSKTGRLSDGGGLVLQTTKAGSRSWLFIYRWHDKRPEIGLGAYPAVSLADARKKAQQGREWLAETPKRNPRDEWTRITEAERASTSQTFGGFALSYLESIEGDFRNAKHRQQWRNTLTTYAAPIWNKDLDEITTDHVLACLQPIWESKHETASRVRGRIERVLDAASVRKLRTGDNPARWSGHLKMVLPNKKPKPKHFPAMDYAEVPAFMTKLADVDTIGAKCLRFAILTGSRSGEARMAAWDEIDLKQALWTLPENRTKTEIEHRVPLSDAALQIVREMNAARSSALVFPGTKPERPLSDMTLTAILRRWELPYTQHGFRSSFRDWAGDETDFDRESIELCISHKVTSATEAAYRRKDALAKRRVIMQAWAEYCTRSD
jgi:integrase